MIDPVAAHYSGSGALTDAISENLRSAGKDVKQLTTADLAAVDEFHIRGRKATLELAKKMQLTISDSRQAQLCYCDNYVLIRKLVRQ